MTSEVAPTKAYVPDQRIRMSNPVQSPCPGCGKPLDRGKSVCSPRCRTRRWRAHRTASVVTLRGQLVALAALIEQALPMLSPPDRRKRRG